MRLPLSWLVEHCDPGLEPRALEERLTMTGTKVEAVHHHGVDALEHFVVGHVLDAVQHPNADRLRVCSVDVGAGEPQQIVCGAPNVAAGQRVAVARPGAVMPDGTRLKKAKLRGEASNGMILAEDEVAIGTDHDGIMVLDGDWAPGTPLSGVLPISTAVLELEITPNRPDCLGIYGVAREVHAATGAPLAPPPWADDPGADGEVPGMAVDVQAPDLCPRFTARLFEGVRIGPSPHWLKARLMAAGQRPINNVVDITNYVMLETGQPMHAFDADLIAGGRLVVRRARDGETITTLDDVERTLDADMCVIEDAEGPTSIAGIMGGARSEVGDTTTRVLMEAATWNGPNLQRTSTRLGLRTEASGRFEKQLQPEQGMEGQALATRLMLELTGARAVGGTIDVGGPGPAPAAIRLRDEKVSGLLGEDIPRSTSATILEALGFGVAPAEDGLEATVPHWRRGDVYREADLIEEVARVHGFEHLPVTLPSRRGATGVLSAGQRARRRAEDALVGAGLHEIVGWSFEAPDAVRSLRIPDDDPRGRPLALVNPLSEDQSVMRTTLLHSLRTALERNVRRGRGAVRLFEVGAVYLPSGEELPDERQHLGALLWGPARPASWGDARPPEAGFYAAKGVLETLLRALRVSWEARRAPEPFLHPGRAAAIFVEDRAVGWLGELHPAVAGDLGVVAGFELDLGAVLAAATTAPRYRDLTSYPSVLRDLALSMPVDVPAGALLETVREAGTPLLAAAEVFDVYTGAQAGEGRKSVALRLEFRAPDRTLTDEDAAGRVERILAAVRDRHDAASRV
jgi:phenylalanyl-tRNA synthetase beta chain